MKLKVLPLLLLACSFEALAISRIKCPEANPDLAKGKSEHYYQSFMNKNKIVAVTPVTSTFMEMFKQEFEKFPKGLHRELKRAGNVIHVMEGPGVTVDPSWDKNHVTTHDGRPWAEVPGSGGYSVQGYLMVPTRVVINHLYDKHGTVSMLLHEHGHSLDSIKDFHGISKSQLWSDLLRDEPRTTDFLQAVCGKYCVNNIEEGFAELFAHYYACDESRQQLQRELPRTAEFFRRFTSTKKLDTIWDEENTTQGKTPQRRGSIFGGRLFGL